MAPAVVHLAVNARRDRKQRGGTGSGFFFTPDGLLLTKNRSQASECAASLAGIDVGDLIVGLDGELVSGIDKLQQSLDARRIGRDCEIVLLRHTRKVQLRVTAIERPN